MWRSNATRAPYKKLIWVRLSEQMIRCMLMHCLIVNHAYVGGVRLQQRTASAVFLYRYTVHLPNDFNEDFVYVNFTFRRRFHKRTAPELCQRNSIVDRNFALACQVALFTDPRHL